MAKQACQLVLDGRSDAKARAVIASIDDSNEPARAIPGSSA